MSKDRCEYPPGHPEAVKIGCLCPTLTNGHGRGCGVKDEQGNPPFWFNHDCPIHGRNKAEPVDDDALVFEHGGG